MLLSQLALASIARSYPLSRSVSMFSSIVAIFAFMSSIILSLSCWEYVAVVVIDRAASRFTSSNETFDGFSGVASALGASGIFFRNLKQKPTQYHTELIAF